MIRSDAITGTVSSVYSSRVLPAGPGDSVYVPSIRIRLYLPPRPRWTMRNGGSSSTSVTSAQLKRLSGCFIRKRAPAPVP